jgi:hypothetical protein
VLDDKGQPLEGFFALLHVGREDSGEMYLLSAKDIVDKLSLSTTHFTGRLRCQHNCACRQLSRQFASASARRDRA